MAATAKEPTPPSPKRPWAPPGLPDYERDLARRGVKEKSEGEHARIDSNRVYALPELIHIAQRNNPETRVAWERARQAAAAVGLTESLYYPYLVASEPNHA
jgi:outer membrane protein TolC